MNKLRAITVFRRVVELGSFKAAAEDLALSKAAISKNINELEDYLKSPLINRTTRKMHITENGQRYYNHVRTILDDLKNADLSIIEASHQPRGLLRVSVPMSFGLAHINIAICQFMNLYPEISVEVMMSDQYIDLVEQGLDVAIRGGGTLKDSTLKARKLTDITRVLCASPDYIKNSVSLSTPDDLSAHNCLVYSLSLSPTSWVFRNDDNVKAINIVPGSYVVDNGLALTQAALSGLGIIRIPGMLVEKELQSGELVTLLPEWSVETQALYAIYPYHREVSQKVRTFIDFLTDYFSQ